MVGNVYFETYGWVRLALPIVGMIAKFDISEETFSIDILTVLKSSLKHRRKHVPRSLQLSADQA